MYCVTVLVIRNSKVYVESKQQCVQRFSHASVAALWMASALTHVTYQKVEDMALVPCSVTMQ